MHDLNARLTSYNIALQMKWLNIYINSWDVEAAVERLTGPRKKYTYLLNNEKHMYLLMGIMGGAADSAGRAARGVQELSLIHI